MTDIPSVEDDPFPTMAKDATLENLTAAYPQLPLGVISELLAGASVMFNGVRYYRSYEDYVEH